MVARELEDVSEGDVVENGDNCVPVAPEKAFQNAEEEIAVYQNQLVMSKDNLTIVADMYQQDYIDKVEQRSDLANEARAKAVDCLVEVSKKIYDLAGCFSQLLEDQAEKLQKIENMTVTASASLEITSCYDFRNGLHSRLPPATLLTRQPRIRQPDNKTEEFREKVTWEKLNYNKFDRMGAGMSSEFEHYEDAVESDPEITPATGIQISTSQQSIHSESSNNSYNTAASAISSTAPTASSNTLQTRDNRLSVSSVDVRQPTSPAMNRYGSTTSLTSLNSVKSSENTSSSNVSSTVKYATIGRNPVKRTLSSLRLQPARCAPAPPPAKQNAHRPRVYSVKNQTGEGLEKPSIPAPRPPPSDEDHYAVPPSHRLSTLNEERSTPTPAAPEVIYDDVRTRGGVVPGPIPEAPPAPQYQQIAVGSPNLDDNIYTDSDALPPPPPTPGTPGYIPEDLPPPPPDLIPPPPDDDELYADMDVPQPPRDDDVYTDMDGVAQPPEDDEELYADMDMPRTDNIYSDNVVPQDNIYTDNVVDNSEMANNAHTVSVSKDSGFYTEEQEEEDPVIERVRVIFPYAATASDELNLVIGDMVSVHVKNPDGWYEGTLNGVRGLFPGNYVETLQ